MDASPSALPKPAALMRRMTASAEPIIRRDASAPLLRYGVELNRGSLMVQLEPAAEADVSIQWTQNGVPIQGQVGATLHLANLAADDTDIYFARLRSAAGESHSQAFLVVVQPGHPLLNFSTRGYVTPGHPLIAGFVVGRAGGSARSKRYLLRAVGKSLQRFGVTETVQRPTATLFRRGAKGQETVTLEQDSAFIREWAPKVGAMALDRDATEFVGVAELAPGPYSVVAHGADHESGEVLVEIYELPT